MYIFYKMSRSIWTCSVVFCLGCSFVCSINLNINNFFSVRWSVICSPQFLCLLYSALIYSSIDLFSEISQLHFFPRIYRPDFILMGSLSFLCLTGCSALLFLHRWNRSMSEKSRGRSGTVWRHLAEGEQRNKFWIVMTDSGQTLSSLASKTIFGWTFSWILIQSSHIHSKSL